LETATEEEKLYGQYGVQEDDQPHSRGRLSWAEKERRKAQRRTETHRRHVERESHPDDHAHRVDCTGDSKYRAKCLCDPDACLDDECVEHDDIIAQGGLYDPTDDMIATISEIQEEGREALYETYRIADLYD